MDDTWVYTVLMLPPPTVAKNFHQIPPPPSPNIQIKTIPTHQIILFFFFFVTSTYFYFISFFFLQIKSFFVTILCSLSWPKLHLFLYLDLSRSSVTFSSSLYPKKKTCQNFSWILSIKWILCKMGIDNGRQLDHIFFFTIIS